MKNAKTAYAIVRLENCQDYAMKPENMVTVKVIVWSEEKAISEVERLKSINPDTVYFWQATRVIEHSS